MFVLWLCPLFVIVPVCCVVVAWVGVFLFAWFPVCVLLLSLFVVVAVVCAVSVAV